MWTSSNFCSQFVLFAPAGIMMIIIVSGAKMIRARGCRAAYFGPWVRWERGLGRGAVSVCVFVCVLACLFRVGRGRWPPILPSLVLNKGRRRARATHRDPPKRPTPGDPGGWVGGWGGGGGWLGGGEVIKLSNTYAESTFFTCDKCKS